MSEHMVDNGDRHNGHFHKQHSEDGDRENKNFHKITLKVSVPPSNSAGGSAIGSPSTLDRKTRNRIERLERRLDLRNYTDQNYPFGLFLQKFTASTKTKLKELLTELSGPVSATKRREETLNFIIKNRRRIGKLAAITRWAKDVNDVQAAHDINTGLILQNQKYDEVVRYISEIHKLLSKARVRKFSLTTALDVITTGEIQAMPSIIEDHFCHEPLTQAQVDKALDVTSDYIFMRFIKSEIVPDAIRRNSLIENGKLILTMEGEYQITLTLLGPDMILPWHVVSINLFIAEEGLDTEDGKLYYVNDIQYLRLIEMTQQALLPIHLRLEQPPDTVIPPDPPASYHYDGPPTKSQALVHMHDFLHSFCLQSQMEMMYNQAYKMALSGWNGNLRTMMDYNNSSLKLSYWSRRLPMNFQVGITNPTTESAQHLTIIKTSGCDARLTLDWGGYAVTSLLEVCSQEDLDSIDSIERDFKITSTSLNVEKLMKQAIRLHSKLILFKLRDLTLNPVSKKITKHLCLPVKPEDIQLDNDDIPSLTVKLSEKNRLRMVVQYRTGFIKPYFESMDNYEGVDTEFERRLNDEPVHVGLLIQHWKFRHVINDFRQVAAAAGLSFQLKLRLDKSDTIKFGELLHRMLFIEVPNAKNSFLVVGIVDHNLRFWFITVSIQSNLKHTLTSLIELDGIVAKLIHRSYVGGSEFSMTKVINILNDVPNTDLIDRLMNLCQGYNIVNGIESQLTKYKRRFTKFSLFEEQLTAPYFVPSYLRAFNPPALPGPNGALIHRSVTRIFAFQHKSSVSSGPLLQSKTAVYTHPTTTTWVAFTCAVDPSYPFLEHAGEIIKKSPATWCLSQEPVSQEVGAENKFFLTFIYHEFTNCYQQFVEDYFIVQKIAKLYLAASQLNLGQYGMEISDYDLQSFTITYNKFFWLKIGFSQTPLYSEPGVMGPYRLSLQLHANHPDKRRNPHLLIEQFLQDILERKSLADLVVAVHTTFNLVNLLEEYQEKTTVGAVVVAHSATQFRILFNSTNGLDISIIAEDQILIQDSSVHNNPSCTVVEPFLPYPETKVAPDVNETTDEEDEDEDLEKMLQKAAKAAELMEEESKKPKKRKQFTAEQLQNVVVVLPEGYDPDQDSDYLAEEEEKAKETAKPVYNPFHLKLQAMPYFKHFALHFSSLAIRVLGKDGLSNGPVMSTSDMVICSSSWTLVALRAFEWVLNVFTWFPRIYSWAHSLQEPNQPIPEKNFDELKDFEVPFTFESCKLTLNVTPDLCHITMEPTKLADHNLLTLEETQLMCQFFTKKVNTYGAQTFESLKSIYCLLKLPIQVIKDFLAVLRLVESNRQCNNGLNLEWLLTMPPHNSQFFPGFPRPLAPVFTIDNATLKALFAIKTDKRSILLPLTFDLNTRVPGVWQGSNSETNEPISRAQFQPLHEWLLTVQNNLGNQPFTYILTKLLEMDANMLNGMIVNP